MPVHFLPPSFHHSAYFTPQSFNQTSQPKDVIEVAVREQDAGEVFKTRFGSFDLAQGSFSAINEEAGLVVFYDEGGKSRCAEGAAAEVPKNEA